MVAQPTEQSLLDTYRRVARAQKRAEKAAREAAQEAARAHDAILEFCIANGIEVVVND